MFEMFLQQVAAEIALTIAPHRVHVVRATLRIVVFDDERRPAETIIVTLATLLAAHPGKTQGLDARRGDCCMFPI